MTPLSIDAQMRAAFSRAGAPLWMAPSDAERFLLDRQWSADVASELCHWFARVWSMTFAAGYLCIAEPRFDTAGALCLLRKMGYAERAARKLVALLTDRLPSLYAKGKAACARGENAAIAGHEIATTTVDAASAACGKVQQAWGTAARALCGSVTINGHGIYRDPHELRGNLVRAQNEIAEALNLLASIEWPCAADYDLI